MLNVNLPVLPLLGRLLGAQQRFLSVVGETVGIHRWIPL